MVHSAEQGVDDSRRAGLALLHDEQIRRSDGGGQSSVLVGHDYEFFVEEGFSKTSTYSLGFDTFLFNEERHIKTQVADGRLLTFYLAKKSNQEIQARFRLIINGHAGFSPAQGTFGGLEYKNDLETTVIDKFVKLIFKNEVVGSLKRLTIKEKPSVYDAHQAIKMPAFVQDVNQHLMVDETPFIDKIHSSEKRRLRKCRRAGFEFQEIQNPDYQQLYQFVQDHRKRKAMPMTIDLPKLQNLFETLPDDFKIFAVKEAETIIALSVMVRLNAKAQYTFLPADHANYLQFSPSVMLYEGIYNYCLSHNYSILDFGISSQNGVLNEGLFNFKRHLGCETSEKMTFRKN